MSDQKMQLVITMHENRSIEVTGPIQDKILCYGLLESAHDAIKDFHDKQAQSRVVPAAPSDVLALRRNHQ